jgi:hypothetical protein
VRNASEVLRHVTKQLDELRFGVFENPPSDWTQFQRLLGQYQALKVIETELITARSKPEN